MSASGRLSPHHHILAPVTHFRFSWPDRWFWGSDEADSGCHALTEGNDLVGRHRGHECPLTESTPNRMRYPHSH